MLSINNLCVSINNTPLLHNITYTFVLGKNYCLLGKNGSGKSSFAHVLMGNPSYNITCGSIMLDENDLTKMEPDERAKAGIFLAFQSIPEIPGIKVFEFLRSIYYAKTGENIGFIPFKKKLLPLADEIGLDHELLWRDLNVGFSGGERRKLEVLQIKILTPRYIILDEIDSGLDVDAFHTIAHMLSSMQSSETSLIIITHLFSILEYIPVDYVIVFDKGRIAKEGGQDLAITIRNNGFTDIIE